ncbi:MAG: TatD family hydrolase [Bacteroidales bacterium]|nr:TatD family hydrolase [Bacteroidales bacterium]MBN2758603.1 TatD family hydrolase [Bacteroidales bacterium]
MLIDTHTHLFLDAFDSDIEEVINSAIGNNVEKFFLPNIDSSTIERLLNISKKYPNNCYPLIGLHPTSVKENYKQEIDTIEYWLTKEKFYAIGEIGIDLYWDKTFEHQQEDAFKIQIEIAKKHSLPIIIHARESFNEIFSIIDQLNDEKLTGIFHSFTGNKEQAEKIINYGGFKIGINGIVTFKNSELANIVKQIGIEHILLETDSPYLAPHPKRGRRNESSFLIYTAKKIAELYNISIDELADVTTENAKQIFKF